MVREKNWKEKIGVQPSEEEIEEAKKKLEKMQEAKETVGKTEEETSEGIGKEYVEVLKEKERKREELYEIATKEMQEKGVSPETIETIEKMKEELTSLEEQVKNLETQNEDLKGKNERLEEELEKTSRELNKDEIEELNRELDEKAKELAKEIRVPERKEITREGVGKADELAKRYAEEMLKLEGINPELVPERYEKRKKELEEEARKRILIEVPKLEIEKAEEEEKEELKETLAGELVEPLKRLAIKNAEIEKYNKEAPYLTEKIAKLVEERDEIEEEIENIVGKEEYKKLTPEEIKEVKDGILEMIIKEAEKNAARVDEELRNVKKENEANQEKMSEGKKKLMERLREWSEKNPKKAAALKWGIAATILGASIFVPAAGVGLYSLTGIYVSPTILPSAGTPAASIMSALATSWGLASLKKLLSRKEKKEK
ncbi:MAG: hypothetical protein QME61_02800 [Patescibacteria group bacterium]|nr:hypothetical protein [Patescibacteria group bacterium]